MSDIVDRLRHHAECESFCDSPSGVEVSREAADEIERLVALVDNAAAHWIELCRTIHPPIPFEGAIDGAMEAACEEVKRLRARVAELEAAQEWRPLYDEAKDEWIVPADVDVLLFMPSTHPQLPDEIKAGFVRSTKGGWFAGWATHWLPLPAPPKGAT